MITIGIVTPHAAAGADVELDDLAGGRVSTRVTRIATSDDGAPPTSADALRALARPDLLDAAVSRLDPPSLDVLAHASTSTAYALGPTAERELVARLRARWSLPVASTPACAADALHSRGVRRLALVHPPWFGAERAALGRAYFAEQGFTVVQQALADVPGDPALVEPRHVLDWVARHADPRAEAVFLGGNGFRAARAVEVLEQRLGCLVLESNQVLLWSALRDTGVSLALHGAGSLLDDLARPLRPERQIDDPH